MGLEIKVQWPATLKGEGAISKIEAQKPSILLNVGTALQTLLKDYMLQLDSARSKRGSHHFTPQGIYNPEVSGDTVKVPIYIPGITRALHDIVIKPVEANALAIPVNEDAYHYSPREYNVVHPKGTKDALFHPKGKDYLAKNDNGNLVVMYLLRKSVHQSQDESLLPSNEAMNKTINETVSDAIEAILTH